MNKHISFDATHPFDLPFLPPQIELPISIHKRLLDARTELAEPTLPKGYFTEIKIT